METRTSNSHPDPRASGSSGEGRGGLLLVDKPAGITSHDAVAIVRRATRTKRVGHTGTLDPFATGLLIVLIGRGTRLIPYVEDEPKVYDATIRLGVETDTDDATGTVTREATPPDNVAIAEAIARLTGTIDQIPPAYSAKQVDGRRAYDAARKGAPLDLPAARITVHEWKILSLEGTDLVARITCGSGTYIRALARDLGRLAGSAAHLAALRRVRSGGFDVAGAASIEQIKSGDFSLTPLLDAIPSIPRRALTPGELIRVSHGNAIDAADGDDRVALLDADDMLVAVADREGTQLRPRLVLIDG
jgi:tRNA pseudouridine55 synthase